MNWIALLRLPLIQSKCAGCAVITFITVRRILVAIIWLFVAAVVLVGPAFALLFYLQGRSLLYAEDAQIALAGVPGIGTRPPAGPRGQQLASGSPGSGSRAAALGLVAVGALVRALGRRRGR